ncbi:MAG: hypothetical protein L0H53_08240 [Candidatus Nitrosocosmicus sp.]|nr:hypothetical protein [Candidatus Nitrosocosmicus sp.]MDN5867181.1 hypothetical protein [Candidatus Nitrosocosmicus sp.]
MAIERSIIRCFDIIDDEIPVSITLESFGMRSETLAKLIYDLDKDIII